MRAPSVLGMPVILRIHLRSRARAPDCDRGRVDAQAPSAGPPPAAPLFAGGANPKPQVLQAASFQHFIVAFNQGDTELYPQFIPNRLAWDFLKDNIPLFDCPDNAITEIYYFRWWTYRKHIAKTPAGFIITEFLPPVPWAGKYNSIACAAGHHFHEGRWLADPAYLDDYSFFWFRRGGEPRRYSFWAAEAQWARYLVSGDPRVAKELLPDLIANYEAWERGHRDANGLFWQSDDRDGMEMSLGGDGCRPTLNSYMYGDALAIAHIATLSGQKEVARDFLSKAADIKRLVQEKLWNPEAQFFQVLPRGQNARLREVREESGYTPWYFDLPDSDQAAAWSQIMDGNGFRAPFGPTTAEQRSPGFSISYQGHECQWNGPSWPYATSVTLTALANLLDNYDQDTVSRKNYFDLLKTYAKSHHRQLQSVSENSLGSPPTNRSAGVPPASSGGVPPPILNSQTRSQDGRVVPWIDEDINPTNGDWIARTLLQPARLSNPGTGQGL